MDMHSLQIATGTKTDTEEEGTANLAAPAERRCHANYEKRCRCVGDPRPNYRYTA